MKGLFTLALVLATGCGEVVKNNNNDADGDTDGDTDGDADGDTDGDTDADGDIVEPDAPPQPQATRFRALTLDGTGNPATDATFLVQDASGGVVATGAVDVDGYFSVDLLEPVTVTLIRKEQDDASSRSYVLETLLGVKPGDDLVFGIYGTQTLDYTSTMSTVVSKVPNYSKHSLATPCFNDNTNADGAITLRFTDACHGATFEVFGVATGGPGADRFFYEPSQTFQGEGTFTAPEFVNTVRPFTMSLTNLPTDVSFGSASRSTLVGTTEAYTSGASVSDPAGNVDLALIYPPFPEQRVQTQVNLSPGTTLMSYFDDRRSTAVNAVTTIDFAEHPLPVLDTLTMDQTGFQWTESANSGTGDMAGAFGYYQWTDDMQRAVAVQWRIFGATLTSPLVMPRLPDDLASLDPQNQAVLVNVYGGIVGIEVDRIQGYDEMRPVFDMTLFEIDQIEVLYPGESFVMRRTQAFFSGGQGRAATAVPNLFSPVRSRGAHAGQ